VNGLTIGGDDYLTKPFGLEELAARIRAVLRRTRPGVGSGGALEFADLCLDQETYEVRRAGHLIELSPTEFRLLRFFMLNPGRVLTRAQLLDHVWNYDFAGGSTVVSTYVAYLRRKLARHGPELIRTQRAVGYCLRMPSSGDDASDEFRPDEPGSDHAE
jgi:two-component system OmpR family response regulator